MLAAALFAIIEEACTSVLILTEEVAAEEFLRSRITRAEVLRQLRSVAAALGEVPQAIRAALPELEWEGWAATARNFDAPGTGSGDAAGEAIWFAVRSLAPATLMWLRVYRRSRPELFAYTTMDKP